MTSAGSITFDYDGRGNMLHRTNGLAVTTYTYNSADQLTNVTATGVNATYAYDADGRRVKQTLGSTVTNFLWDEASTYGDIVYEYNGSGAMLASYVLGGTELISQTRSGTTSYYLQDGQGSTRALTSGTGTVTDTYSYTAFGEQFTHTGSTTNPYQYTGQQFDSLTGLYDLRARYYNPALGRFLSQDTYPYNFSNPIELNRYVYTANRPINAIDPSGNLLIESIGFNINTSRNIEQAAEIGTVISGIYAAILLGIVIGLVVGEDVKTAAVTWDQLYNKGPLPNPPSENKPGGHAPGWPIAIAVLLWYMLHAGSPASDQGSPAPEPSHKVLVVGEGDYSYSDGLIAQHPDWDITTSDYGNGGNNQVATPYGKAIKVRNVDARRLGSGAITGVNQYDIIIFNAPSAIDENRFRGSTDKLIDDVLSSAVDVLKPGGQMRFSSVGFMPGHEHLKSLMGQYVPGYSYSYPMPFLGDEYGIPYNVYTIYGKKLDYLNFQNMRWYIFVK